MRIMPQVIMVIVAGHHKPSRLGVHIHVNRFNPLNKDIINIRITPKRKRTHRVEHVPPLHSVLFFLGGTPEVRVNDRELTISQKGRVRLSTKEMKAPVVCNERGGPLRRGRAHSGSGGRHCNKSRSLGGGEKRFDGEGRGKHVHYLSKKETLNPAIKLLLFYLTLNPDTRTF